MQALGPLSTFSQLTAQVAHQLDVYGEGADDTIWIPQAAADGWTIVTADRGTHSRLKSKLPLLCEAYQVTHILISAGLNKRTMLFKVSTFAAHIEEIIQAASGQRGCRYSLQLTGETSSKLVLVKSPTAEDIAKVQQKLQLLPPEPPIAEP